MTSPSLIAIHSSLPGEGATTIATNLAAMLAMRGKRVCLLDLNFHFADATYILCNTNTKIGVTTNDFLNGRCDIEQALRPIQHSAIKAGGGELLFAPANRSSADMAKSYREDYDMSLLNDGIRDVAQNGMDYILLDTPPGIEENTLLHIAVMDTLLLATKPAQRQLQSLSVLVDIAKKLQVPEMLLLVNKAPLSLRPDDVMEEYRKVFEAPVVGLIHRDDEIDDYYGKNITPPLFFALDKPDHPFSQTMMKVAERL